MRAAVHHSVGGGGGGSAGGSSCGSCGAPNQSAKFCSECGKAVVVAAAAQAPASALLACGKCGAAEQTGKFCSSCGDMIAVGASARSSCVPFFQRRSTLNESPHALIIVFLLSLCMNPPTRASYVFPFASIAASVASAPAAAARNFSAPVAAAASSSASGAFGGGGNKCPTCSKTVYFAEQLMGPANRIYHKMCFRCSECNKMLDAGNCSDKDGVVFCKGCYGAKFGPKGMRARAPAWHVIGLHIIFHLSRTETLVDIQNVCIYNDINP